MHLNIISALNPDSQIQKKLVKKFFDENYCCLVFDINETKHVSTNTYPIVFLLPILGDNDLCPKIEDRIHSVLINNNALAGRRVFVLLTGDRHISDEFIKNTTPVYARLLYLFRHLKSLWMSNIKLDLDTIEELVRSLLSALKSLVTSIPEIEEMTFLLGKAPNWCPHDGSLDLFDASLGRSLLYNKSAKILKRIGELILLIEPKTIILKGAYLQDRECSDLIRENKALYVDLSTNRICNIDLNKYLKRCQWLRLAANDLKEIDLTTLPLSITHLFLYKNRLQHIEFERLIEYPLHSLSLYRNNLNHFNIPSTSLNYLNVGANPLKALPNTLSDAGLHSIGLARTLLPCLPEWLIESTTLDVIDISYIEDKIPHSQIKKLTTTAKRIITRPGYNLQ
ncbi:hypothetical protein TI03_03605 [Achromatium sp. WMS1]|nr:hypothetical protein TI03_03605 [Achromatium sp. WMS1]